MTGQIALLLRTLLLYPLAGLLSTLAIVDFDQATGILTIDLNAGSLVLAGLIWAAVSGGTFGLSRIAKALGWET